MIEELESMSGLSIPKDLASEEANQYLRNACLKYDIKCAPPQTTARLLDKVIHDLFLCWPVICFIFKFCFYSKAGCNLFSLLEIEQKINLPGLQLINRYEHKSSYILLIRKGSDIGLKYGLICLA
jgi:hypothetical protein